MDDPSAGSAPNFEQVLESFFSPVGAFLGMYIGSFIDMMVLGVCITLYGVYCTQNSRPWERALVTSGMIAGIIDTATHLTLLADAGLTKYGNLFANGLAKRWQFWVIPSTTGYIQILVASVYVMRLYGLQETRLQRVFAVVVSSIALLCDFGAMLSFLIVWSLSPNIKSINDPNLESLFQYNHDTDKYNLLYYCLYISADTLICGATVLALRRKKRVGFESTKNLIKKLIRISVKSMLMPSICAWLVLIIHLSISRDVGYFDLVALFPMAKVALMSLLLLLTSRGSGKSNQSSYPSSSGNHSSGGKANKRVSGSVETYMMKPTKSSSSRPFDEEVGGNILKDGGEFSRINSRTETTNDVTTASAANSTTVLHFGEAA